MLIFKQGNPCSHSLPKKVFSSYCQWSTISWVCCWPNIVLLSCQFIFPDNSKYSRIPLLSWTDFPLWFADIILWNTRWKKKIPLPVLPSHVGVQRLMCSARWSNPNWTTAHFTTPRPTFSSYTENLRLFVPKVFPFRKPNKTPLVSEAVAARLKVCLRFPCSAADVWGVQRC